MEYFTFGSHRDVSLHAIIACYGSRGGGLSALVARRPRQPATRAGCKLLLFKTSSLFVSRAKSKTKLAEACFDLNLAIQSIDRQQSRSPTQSKILWFKPHCEYLN